MSQFTQKHTKKCHNTQKDVTTHKKHTQTSHSRWHKMTHTKMSQFTQRHTKRCHNTQKDVTAHQKMSRHTKTRMKNITQNDKR